MTRLTSAWLLLFGLASSFPHVVHAEQRAPSAAERAQVAAAANQLFKRGLNLVNQGDVTAGCDMLDESNRLKEDVSTLVQLARCRKKQQRFASAWASYRQAAELAVLLDDPSIAKVLLEEAKAVTLELSYLTILVPDPVEGLEIRRDNMLVGAIQYGEAIPVDPGDHVITAAAPGYRAVQLAPVNVGTKAENQAVTIPRLELLPPPLSPPELSKPRVPATAAEPTPTVQLVLPPRFPATSARSPWPLVLGGVGTAAVIVGTVAEILAYAANRKMVHDCPERVNCSNEVLELQGRRDFGTRLGYVTLPLGVAALGGAATWMLLSPPTPSKEQPNRLSAGAMPMATGATLWIGGAL